jgi:hypothetical protein
MRLPLPPGLAVTHESSRVLQDGPRRFPAIHQEFTGIGLLNFKLNLRRLYRGGFPEEGGNPHFRVAAAAAAVVVVVMVVVVVRADLSKPSVYKTFFKRP